LSALPAASAGLVGEFAVLAGRGYGISLLPADHVRGAADSGATLCCSLLARVRAALQPAQGLRRHSVAQGSMVGPAPQSGARHARNPHLRWPGEPVGDARRRRLRARPGALVPRSRELAGEGAAAATLAGAREQMAGRALR